MKSKLKNWTLIPNKKGIFFTMMTIVIISLLLVSYTFYSSVKERKVVQKRVETMNNFVNSVEKDLPRKMFVTGFRSIFIFNSKIVDTGAAIDNVSARTEELFFTGNFNGQSQLDLMAGARYEDLVSSLNLDGEKINVDVTIEKTSIKIDQIDPWNVRVTLISNISITDSNHLALWNKTFVSSAFIPTYHFDDPIYLINTGGRIAIKINQTNYQPFDSQNLSSQNLSNHIASNLYINVTDAPSFLDRLEGNLTVDSPYGVESLVNIPLLDAQGITVQQKSIVDHIYFSSTSNPSYCHVAGQPSWVLISSDSPTLTKYNAVCG